MLFQRGFVKLLFATETFAMGVNMPARTVVFDSVRKHDGKQFRTLKPAEYIQMAGRAGRRGLDTTGTVIILCKAEVQEMSELYSMMQGKPTKLESKFRLTYSMILNLLRVEQLRVEDMMKRSFSELDNQKKQGDYKERLKALKKRLEELPQAENSREDMKAFYERASDYLSQWEKYASLVLSHPAAVKMLVGGRALLVLDRGRAKPAILLEVDSKAKEKMFSVLVHKSSNEEVISVKMQKMLSLAFNANVELSEEHEVVKVKAEDILDVCSKSPAKIDAQKVMADVKQRRDIPRFRDNPPGQSTALALQELIKMEVLEAAQELETVNLAKELKIQDLDLVQALQAMGDIRQQLRESNNSAPDFEERFHRVFQLMSLQEEIADVEFLVSEESLTHLKDYKDRVEVLKRLKYIDDNCTVKLKGRVACEMGSQELIITELVLDNVLTDRPPAEIAALLSCMVFQQKNCSEPELTERLKEGVERVKEAALVIGQMQRECGMEEAPGDYAEQFHFGLTEVVYEWARGVPFNEITRLTDVQEGVVVRTIQRLDETLRDVKDAARVIGDSVLYRKMDEASAAVKRDIVFAASLYTQ